MRKLIISALIGLVISLSVNAEKIIVGSEASKTFKGADMIRYKDNVVNPVYIRFKENQGPDVSQIESWIVENFNLSAQFTFESVLSEEDNLGWSHISLIQNFNGMPVEFAKIKVHLKSGAVVSISGYSKHNIAKKTHQLTEEQALLKALEHVGASQYVWQNGLEESLLKMETGNPEATYYPVGDKVFVPENINFTIGNLTPCWKFDVFAAVPASRADIYVDANNGDIIFENKTLLHADSMGTALTTYSGLRDITTDYVSSGNYYRLQESGRGNGVFTLDANNTTNAGSAIEFVDSTNVWPDTLRISYATDAHWAAEKSYDYLLNIHGRNGIDGNGFALRSYVHWGVNWANASWDGQRMRYGDGNTNSKPYTSLDICGHELTHGLTGNTAALIYRDESGALNESFSDIFGCAIEIHNKPNITNNWLMGEDRGNPIRNMKSPNTKNDPDTYEGTFWWTSASDNGGVHTNSGVQNFWFYLLTVGGSGTNDNNDAYSVTGLGISKAEAIAFRNLTVYLSQSSDYEDARFYSIVSAVDIHGACTPELASTVNAWYAVGIGDEYVSTVTSAFTVDKVTACSWPEDFYFENLSNFYNVQNFVWDFGDTKTSTDMSPVHTYTSDGVYTVKLTANGGTCGTDVELKTNYIDIEGPIDVTAANVTTCDGDPAVITAVANDDAFWYDNATATNPVFIGNPFVTPPLSADATYYVENVFVGQSGYVGPDTIIGFGAYFSGYQYLVFDVNQKITLRSVKVFANGKKGRVIQLRNSAGQVINTKAVTVDDGTQRVDLDFVIPPGQDYQLGVPFNSSTDLWRNSSNVKYPYNLNGLVTITESSAGADYYYYFYDWDVKAEDCKGTRIAVDAKVDFSPDCIPFYDGTEELEKDNLIEIFPNPSNGKFSINMDLLRDQKMTIELFDVNGRVVKLIEDGNITSGLQTIKVDVNSLDKGLYMIRFIGEDFSKTDRLVIGE